jgi:hypothetical protein
MNSMIKTVIVMSAMVLAILIPVGLSQIDPHREQFVQGSQEYVLGTSEVIAFTPPFQATSTTLFATTTSTTTAVTTTKQASSQSTVAKAKVRPKPTYTLSALTSTEELDSVLHYIAQCESGHDPLARNKTSSAKGLLQIIDGTWKNFKCEGNVLNREDNYNCGVKIATQSGLHHWDASASCWMPLVKKGQIADNRIYE